MPFCFENMSYHNNLKVASAYRVFNYSSIQLQQRAINEVKMQKIYDILEYTQKGFNNSVE